MTRGIQIEGSKRDTECSLRLGKESGAGESFPSHLLGFGHQAEYIEQPRPPCLGMNRLVGEIEG